MLSENRDNKFVVHIYSFSTGITVMNNSRITDRKFVNCYQECL